jgi:hypothetical protein
MPVTDNAFPRTIRDVMDGSAADDPNITCPLTEIPLNAETSPFIHIE